LDLSKKLDSAIDFVLKNGPFTPDLNQVRNVGNTKMVTEAIINFIES
jgi:hypothetical protein